MRDARGQARAPSRCGRASRPPRRRRASPATSPSTAPAGRARRPARGAAGTTAATPRGRRRAAASSSARGAPDSARPRRRSPRARRRPSSARRRGSPRAATARSSRRAVESVSTACTSSQTPVDGLRLVRLQVPDEVPAERVAVDGVLREQVLRAVLPHHLAPRPRRGPPCPRASTYFVAATTVTPARGGRAVQRVPLHGPCRRSREHLLEQRRAACRGG